MTSFSKANVVANEAAWIRWSCYNMYKLKADIKKAADVQRSVIQKAKIPSIKSIQKRIEEIVNKIWVLTNITIEDKNVVKELERLALHENDKVLF